MIFLGDLATCQCPVPRCPGVSRSRSGLHSHFNRRHSGDSLLILQERPMLYPHRDRCVQQVALWLPNNRHFNTAVLLAGREQLWRWETLQQCFAAHQVVLNVNMNPFESTAAFSYLGRTVAYNNTDWASSYANFRKAQKRWGVVAKFLIQTGAHAKARSML